MKNLNLIKEKDFLNCLLIFKVGGDTGINIKNKLKYRLKKDKSKKILYKSFKSDKLKNFLLDFNTFINFIPVMDKFYLYFDEDKMIKVLKSVKYFSNSDIDIKCEEIEKIFNYLLKKNLEVKYNDKIRLWKNKRKINE